MLAPLRWFLWLTTRPREIRPGLASSIGAAYTAGELRELVRGTALGDCAVSSNPLGVTVVGVKSGPT